MCSVCDDVEARRVRAGRVDLPFGGIAQMVERYHGMVDARGSSPLTSTVRLTLENDQAERGFLAGVVAGEGTFFVLRRGSTFVRDGHERLRFVFGVHMARRDRHLLERMQSALSCGSIS